MNTILIINALGVIGMCLTYKRATFWHYFFGAMYIATWYGLFLFCNR